MEASTPMTKTISKQSPLAGRAVNALLSVGSKDALFLRMNSVNKRSFRLLGPPDSIYVAHLVFHPSGFDGGVGAPLLQLEASASQPYTWETSIDLSQGSELWQLIQPYISLSGEEGIQTDLQIYEAVPQRKPAEPGVGDLACQSSDGSDKYNGFNTFVKCACYAVHLTSHQKKRLRQNGRWSDRLGRMDKYLHGIQSLQRSNFRGGVFTARKQSQIQAVLLLAAQIGQAPLAS